MLDVGSLIAGRYRLETLVGEGGMASVWRAEDQTLKRMVAVKLLYVRGQRDPRAVVDQFLREARIAASVQHRNVIHTMDFGIADEQLPYMVMELLTGESLAERMERKPALTMEEVVHFASLTLRGLGAVHEAGIVHRDLKPQNIFLHQDSDTVYPKILDFGISRSLADDPQRPSAISTQDGMIVGTPDYMSPEQARGEAGIDKRADIYSMGAIIYEGITGRLPYEADTIGQLIVKIVTTQPPSMRSVRPDVPELLSDCVAQAMAHDREERFVDATVFRRALLSAAESAFSAANARRPQTSDAPPRAPRVPSPLAAPVPAPMPALAIAPLPLAPAASLPLGLPSSAGNAGDAAWGDFEGLDARSGKPVQKLAEPALRPTPRQPGASQRLPEAAPSMGAGDPTLLGASPFDALGASGTATLDIDYDRGTRGGQGVSGSSGQPRIPHSPVQRSAVHNQRPQGNAAARSAATGRGPAPVANLAQAVRKERAAPSRAIWIAPAGLLFGFVLLLFAPGIFSAAGPDARAASELEAKNPATAGSDRELQATRRHDLGKRPPALRDVVF